MYIIITLINNIIKCDLSRPGNIYLFYNKYPKWFFVHLSAFGDNGTDFFHVNFYQINNVSITT